MTTVATRTIAARTIAMLAFLLALVALPSAAWASEAQEPAAPEETATVATAQEPAPATAQATTPAATAGDAEAPTQAPAADAAAPEDETVPTGEAAGADAAASATESSPAAETQAAQDAPAKLTAQSTPAAAASAAATQASSSSSASAQASSKTAQRLADGVYYIESARNLNMTLDMSGASKANDGNAIVWTFNGDANQRWRIQYDSSAGFYRIINVNSGKALDVAGGVARNGANVLQYTRKTLGDMRNQLWSITDMGNGYKIASALNQAYVLGVYGGTAKAGQNVNVQTSSDGAWQRWWLLPEKASTEATKADIAAIIGTNAVYTIARADTPSKLVDVVGASSADGANVDLWQSNGGANQKWALVRDSSNYYTIVSVNSGKALDVSAGSMLAAANVLQWQSKGSDNQKWAIQRNANGTYSFISKQSGMALYAYGNGKADGTNIVTNFANGSAGSQFVLTAVDRLLADGFYSIGMRSKTTQVVDVAGSSNADNLQLETWDYNGGFNQKVKVTGSAGDIYTLQLANSGKYLADSGSGRALQQQLNASSASQRWHAVWTGLGIQFVNQQTGKALAVQNGSTADGAALQTAAPSSAAAQQFILTGRNLIDNGLYNVRSAIGSRLLDVNGASKANGANILVWQSNNGYNQKFTITHVNGGYYKLVNVESGKAVATSGNNVVQTTYSGAAAQLWQADISPMGGLVFINRQTGRALDVAGGKNANGTNVDVAAVNRTAAAQRWTLVPTVTLTAAQQDALNRITARNSNTNYAISVNLSTHWVWVFERASKSSPWKLKFEWRCSNGARDTPTPAVNRLSSGYKRYKSPDLNPQGVPYASSFYYMTYVDSGKYFHSILYKKGSTTQVKDGRLGKSISNGCIRLETKNAIWIYNNIKKGTRIITYY